VFGKRSQGEVFGSFLYDEEIDPNTAGDPFGRERWTVHGEQDIFLPYDWRLKSDFQFISDNEYLVDFDDLPERLSDRFLQSNAFVGRAFGGGRDLHRRFAEPRRPGPRSFPPAAASNAGAGRAAGLRHGVGPGAVPDHPGLRRRVHLLRSAAPCRRQVRQDDPNFVDTGIDAIPSPSERGYVDPGNLDPHDDDDDPLTPTTEGPELDGVYQEGEPLADDGHRLDLFPRLGLPFRIGDFVEAYPEVGWHETLYDTHFQGSDERHLLTARLDLRTRLIRRFGEGRTHILEPRLGYALVTDLGQDQRDNPMFVPETAVPQQRVRQLDLSNVTLDRADRIDNFNGITFGVGNRVYGPSGEGGSRLIADFYVSNEFRFDDSEFGSIFVGGRAYPFEGAYLRANLGFDPEETKISEAILQFSYAARAGHSVRLAYRYLRDIPRFFEDFRYSTDRFDEFTESFNRINQVRLSGRLAVTRQWSLHHTVAYTFEDSLVLANYGGIEYVSKCRCWAAGFELSHNRTRGFRFNLVYRLVGMGKQLGYTGPESVGLADLGLFDGF